MAMSLEQLLAEEGFKGRRLKTMTRASTSLQSSRQGRHKPSAPTGLRKAERTKSDIPLYDSETSKSTSERDKHWRPRRGKEKAVESQNMKRSNAESSEESPDSEIIDAALSNEIGGNELRYKEIYSNEIYSHEGNEDKYCSKSQERERRKPPSGKATLHNNARLHPGRTSFSDNYMKNFACGESSNARSKRNSLNCKSFDDSRAPRKVELTEQAVDTPALDEAAIQAIISILSGHIKCFLKDEDFRTSLRHNSFASFNFAALDMKSKIINSLEEAIETVEKNVEGFASLQELKKSSLQLSVITGLNSQDLKDGFTSGIPNPKLAACAHLYLSVVYKLQKKDRIAAKHILQVFIDSPFQARTSLLPDLWDQVFLPHLSHLKVWYIKEVGFLEGTDIRSRNLKLLEKVYNETMDAGTKQFALYYKDWLTEGVEPPSFPSVQIPFKSLQHGSPNNTPHVVGSVSGCFSPQPMVSKKLYEEVFRHSNKTGVEVDNHKEESFEIVENVDQEIEPDAICQSHNMPTIEETETTRIANFSEENKPVEKFSDFHPKLSIPENHIASYATAPLSRPSEVIIKRIAKAFFEQQKTEESDDHPDSMPAEKLLFVQESEDTCGNDSERSLGLSIPPEFICPLTGLVFEDPVTLETGQSFEQAAILNWFSKGNRTCPITSKKLECQIVPLSNFVLKRIIDKWKSEYWKQLLAFSSQLESDSSEDETVVSILEKLLMVSSKDERIENVKQIIGLGGLQFLIHKFNFGNLSEKICASDLLSSCIEADSNCRNLVARDIDKMCLLELLCSGQLESVRNAIALMIELICLNRRKDAKIFLSSFGSEDTENIMHQLLAYLQSSSEQKSMVAVLLLHFCLLMDTQSRSAILDEAVDGITVALESSFLDERPREMCCRALLMLGGRFSSSGKIMTEDWILKHAGFIGRFESDLENPEDNETVDESTMLADEDEEEEAREEWLAKLSASLLGRGKKSFLGALSMCLGSGNTELIRVCLTTVAWLSSVLALLSDSEFELSALSALICQLKVCLEHGDLLEHKVLASVCLLNFSKLPECRVLLMMIGEAIEGTLACLVEVTWAARELHAVISSS